MIVLINKATGSKIRERRTRSSIIPCSGCCNKGLKRVSGLSEGEDDANFPGVAWAAFCSIRLLVASSQAVNLIGKKGSLIKPIQHNTGASTCILSNDEMSIYVTSDERIVEIHGEALKVLKALESVIGHLRKFLVDHSVVPLFEKSCNTRAVQERQTEPWSERTMLTSQPGFVDYPLPAKRDSLFSEVESQLDPHYHSTGLSLY